MELNGTSATIDLGFYKDKKLTVRLKNLTTLPIYVYPETLVASSAHVSLSMDGKREVPYELAGKATHSWTYTISPKSDAPFDPEKITLKFKIAARSANGRLVYPIPEIQFPITFSRHSPTEQARGREDHKQMWFRSRREGSGRKREDTADADPCS